MKTISAKEFQKIMRKSLFLTEFIFEIECDSLENQVEIYLNIEGDYEMGNSLFLTYFVAEKDKRIVYHINDPSPRIPIFSIPLLSGFNDKSIILVKGGVAIDAYAVIMPVKIKAGSIIYKKPKRLNLTAESI